MMTDFATGTSGTKIKNFFTVLVLALAFCLPCDKVLAADARQQPLLYPQHQNMPLAPFLDYFIDESLSMDIEEASSPSRTTAYQPLNLDKLPRIEGIVWLRFILAPMPADAKSPVYLLDMGQSVPGVPRLYDPARNELSGALEWRESTPAQRNILLLPEQAAEPVTCYIRMDGLPGPWFAPMIRNPQDAAGNWGGLARTGAILALAIVMLLCLMRGLSERGQWRIWTSLYVAVALWQALAGMPDVNDNFSIRGLAAILLPGIALMLLPHVGRHLMRSNVRSRGIDIQLILLSLPGAALALWPLFPGWEWLDRWLDLWPAGTIIFVPTALGAWFLGLGGARRFLLGCLMPPLFVGIAILGLDFGLPPNLLASLPLWGVAFGAMLIAVTKSPVEGNEENGEKKKGGGKPVEIPPDAGDSGGIINLDHPLDDPNLRLVGNTGTGGDFEPGPMADDSPLDESGLNSLEEREMALRQPLDEIIRQGASLGECALPPAGRQYAEKMIAASQRLADIITGKEEKPQARLKNGKISGPENFSLRAIMRSAYDAVATDAENAGISLSWYMQPTISQNYLGNAQRLEEALRLLLESAIRATNGGCVNLAAHEVSENGETGHIVFTINDNGHGYPPRDRSGLALAKAWELAGEYNGSLGVEAGPNGASIAFSAHFAIQQKKKSAEPSLCVPHVILACDDAPLRRELAQILASLPCEICEAPGMEEAIECQRQRPGALLITSGSLAMPSAADLVAKFRELATAAGFAQCHVLAVTMDDSQWRLLKPSGFTHAMLAPVDADNFRNTVEELMDQPRNDNGAPTEIASSSQDSGPGDGVAQREEDRNNTEEIKNPQDIRTPVTPAPASQSQEGNISDGRKSGGNSIPLAPVFPTTAHLPKSGESANENIKRKNVNRLEDFIQGFEGPHWLGNEEIEGNGEEVFTASNLVDQDGSRGKNIEDTENEDKNASPVEDLTDAENANQEILTTTEAPNPMDQEDKERLSADGGESLNVSPQPADGAELNNKVESENGEMKEIAEPSGDSITDFIVGIKNDITSTPETNPPFASPYEEARKNAKIAIAAQKNSSVGKFVNSSVEIVTKTFTAALAGKREDEKTAPARPVVTGKPPSPPVSSPASNTERSAPKPDSAKSGVTAWENKDVRSDPAIINLVQELDAAMARAMGAFNDANTPGIAESTAIIAKHAQAFGLRLLARMAQCVERAAMANDLAAVRDLLPDLANAVERNRIALMNKK